MTAAGSTQPSRAGVAAAFAAVYVIWGSTYLAIRYGIETIPPLLMAGTRFTVAGLLMYAFARLRGGPAPQWRDWPAAASVGVLLVAANGGVSWAEQLVPSALAALLVTAVPLWMVLLNWLRPRGARPSLGQGIGLIMGFFGVVLLVNPLQASGEERGVNPYGAVVLILASLSWATGSLRSRSVKLPPSPWISTGMEMLTGGLAVVTAGLLLGEGARVDVSAISLRSALALGYLIVFGSLIGFTCYVWMMKVSTPARVGTYAYVNPVVAVILGYFIASEPITAWTLFAAAIIVLAVILITSSRPETPVEATTAAPTSEAAVRDGATAPRQRPATSLITERTRTISAPDGDRFDIPELQRARELAGRDYFEFLRKASMSMGLYYLPAGGIDPQDPHCEDEVYVVIAGRARLQVGEEDHDVRSGSIVYVDAGVDHRFHDIEEDVTALVFFAPAEGTQADRFREAGREACTSQ